MGRNLILRAILVIGCLGVLCRGQAAVNEAAGAHEVWLVAVGVNRYQDTDVSQLEFAAADAEALSHFFTGSGLVDRTRSYLLMTDSTEPMRRPTRALILKALQYVAESAGPEATIIFSFSGHGFIDDAKKSFLLPEDGRTTLLADTAIGVEQVTEMVNSSSAKRKLLILDACRNAAQAGTKGADASWTAEFLRVLAGAKGTAVIASCSEGEVSYEMKSTGHGVFTYYLLRGMGGEAANSAGMVTLDSLRVFLQDALSAYGTRDFARRQNPWFSSDMRGDFPLAVKAGDSSGDPTLGRGYTERAGGLDMEMVWIPAGEAELGMVEEDQEIAHYIMPPMHVRMDGYWIGKYEVTNAQWKAIIGKVEDGGEPDLPAAHMYLEDCEAFAQKTSELSGRRYAVPTEAQWEYACRAGTRSTWFFGSKPDRVHEYGWVGRPADGSGPDRVGRKKPNPWGLYDMYGNVAEWTYSLSTSVTNPSAPDPLNPKGFVMRGGAGSFSPLGCSSSSRDWNSRRRGTSFYGFRIARVQGAYVGGTAKPVKLPDAVIRPDPPPVAGMDTDALIARGDALMKTAQYENALRAYTAAAQIAPRSAQARLNRGYALNALDRTEEAIEEFSAALSIDSSLAKAYGNRGYARYKLKQYQGTINDCSKAIELDRGYARAYFNRARAHRQLGNTRAYNADRQAALRLDPRITD